MAYAGHNGRKDTSDEIKAMKNGRLLEYTLNKDHYLEIIKEKPKGIDNYKFALQYINSVYNFNGKVVKINIEG